MTYVEFKENFLPELSNIKSFAGRIKYANENLTRIGSGSGRIVYDIDGQRVLKLAKNAKGVAQNEAEAGAGYYRDTQHIVTEIFDSAEDDSWLLSEKGKKVTENRIKQLTGIPSLNDLYYFLKNEINQNKGRGTVFSQTPEMKEFFWENEFSSDLINFAVNYSQSVGDMGRPSSYGEVLRDGQPSIVLTDYGLNDEVYNTHYSPDRKQQPQYRMYELFNNADGNDDILSDIGGGNEIRTGMWAQVPYSVSDGSGVINEEFINFVSNRDTYPDGAVEGLPVLTDSFHECINNMGEVLNIVENKPKFYNNLLKLQEYLIRRGFFNRDTLKISEDGSSKFTTDNAINQDDFPAYNTNDTSPSINNNLNANSAMYEDLEYNHIDGDATQDEYKLEERNKSFGIGSKTVKVKKKCRLGGLGNTSVACNQGDINNLEFGSVNETSVPHSRTFWAWVSPDNRFIEVPKLNHKALIMRQYKDEEFSWDYDRVFDKALEDGWVRVIFEYKNFNGELNLNGHDKKRVVSVFKTIFADLVKYGSNYIYLEWYNPERNHVGFNTRDAESTGKLAQIIGEEIKNLDIKEYFSSLVPMNENIKTIQELPFRAEVEKLGGQIYAVGGAVRDEYLGKDSKDLDIIVRGIPEDKLTQILKKYGTVKPVGNSFAVTKFIPKGGDESSETDVIDIALPRTEVSTGEGHNDFEITADYRLPIEKDLERRDFTINAIAKDMDGNIIDPFNGVADLKSGEIKITHPKSFIDDPLRMLRAIQFASRFNMEINPNTYKEIKANADKINTIDNERIQIEIEKIVEKGDKFKGAFLLKDSGILRNMGVDAGLLANNVWDKVTTLGEYIYLLSHDATSPVEFYKKYFRGDNDIIDEIEGLSVGMPVESTNKMINRTAAHNMVIKSKGTDVLNSKILPENLQVAAQELLAGKYPKTVNELAVNGNDLMDAGLRGKEIGDMQKSMLMKIYNDDVRNTREELLSLVNQPPEQLKETINEGDEQIEYGALMLFFDIPKWGKITSIIKKEDIYEKNNEFGIETEPHATILYGFHNNVNAEKVFDLYEKNFDLKPIKVEINGISIFENEAFDVVKMDINKGILNKMNSKMRELPCEITYPEYHGHITIAYVKKDAGEKYVKKFEKNRMLVGDELVFSTKKEKKSILKLNDKDILKEEPVKKISYSAVVLDDESRTKLIQLFTPMIPEGWDVFAHHMTIKLGKLPEESQEKYDLLEDKIITLNVVDYAISSLVFAVGVEGYTSKNTKPHITIAVNRNAGGKPVMSNKLTDWKPLGFPMTLIGKVSEEE